MARVTVLALVCGVLGSIGCGGGSDSPGGSSGACVKGTGIYTNRCVTFQCSDGSGSCAINDPSAVQINLQGNGVAMTSDWTTDTNSFTTDGCDQSIVAHKTNQDGSTTTEHLLITCNPAGDSCQESAVYSVPGGTCTENGTLTKG